MVARAIGENPRTVKTLLASRPTDALRGKAKRAAENIREKARAKVARAGKAEEKA